MIVTLKDTTTRTVAEKLLSTHEEYSMASGRVLTLIVVIDEADDVAAVVEAIRLAAHEHPSRVLILRRNAESDFDSLDAKLLFGGDAGSSEMIIMTLHGELANHADSVVTPLLLPDTPIVAWWPSLAPAVPSEDPIGQIAQRRITNAKKNVAGNALLRLSSGYYPGDSDMMWSRITAWRGVVASAIERPPHDTIKKITIIGPSDNPSVDLAAGWLASNLKVPVERQGTDDGKADLFPVHNLIVHRDGSDVEITSIAPRTIRVRVPDHPDALVALDQRSDADCLVEELRHLSPDLTYAKALAGIGKVVVR